MRAHRPQWSMLLYYPAGCSEEMGPTGILEDETGGASHFYQIDPIAQAAVGDGSCLGLSETKLILPVNQGCCVLINFHLWHRGTRRLAEDKRRVMLKFQVFSASNPAREKGSSPSPNPYAGSGAPAGTQAMWMDSLAWLRGEPSPSSSVLSELRREQLLGELAACGTENEQVRLGAAVSTQAIILGSIKRWNAV